VSSYTLIESDQQLSVLCKKLASIPAIAVDTEFIRTDTFYPRLGLVQISDGQQCFLIDPLKLTALAPLQELFTDPGVVKVFHACSEDLEAIHYHYQVLPTPLFDTQLAAAFLGYAAALGYINLVSQLFDVELNKDLTRSNWLKRPLAGKQLEYAALDVEYLLPAYQQLLQALKTGGKLEWFAADQTAVLQKFDTHRNNDESYYLRVKSAWKLNARQLATLKALCEWREQLAKELDRPRGRVLKDQYLYEIALQQITTVSRLADIDDMPAKALNRYGESIVAVVECAMKCAPDHCPETLPRPLSIAEAKVYKAARHMISKMAEELDMARELLLPKKELEMLIRNGYQSGTYQVPPTLSSWRKEHIVQPLINYLETEDFKK
jgi:ribonuclease D